MYQELELWKAEQAKIKARKEMDEWMDNLAERNGTTDSVISDTSKPDEDELLSAALAECFAMGV